MLLASGAVLRLGSSQFSSVRRRAAFAAVAMLAVAIAGGAQASPRRQVAAPTGWNWQKGDGGYVDISRVAKGPLQSIVTDDRVSCGEYTTPDVVEADIQNVPVGRDGTFSYTGPAVPQGGTNATLTLSGQIQGPKIVGRYHIAIDIVDGDGRPCRAENQTTDFTAICYQECPPPEPPAGHLIQSPPNGTWNLTYGPARTRVRPARLKRAFEPFVPIKVRFTPLCPRMSCRVRATVTQRNGRTWSGVAKPARLFRGTRGHVLSLHAPTVCRRQRATASMTIKAAGPAGKPLTVVWGNVAFRIGGHGCVGGSVRNFETHAR